MALDWLEILDGTAAILGLIFPLWPLVLLSAVRSRRRLLPAMLIGWIGMAAIGAFSLTASVRPQWAIIPEPWNKIAFAGTGVLLVTAHVMQKYWRKGVVRQKTNRAHSADELLNLSPREFEEAVAELYAAQGHKVRRPGASGDHGVDVVVEASSGEKWIVQCKRWRGIVGEAVIRDFYGVLHHEKADRGAIITTGTFSFQARQWSRGKPIELVDGEEFLRLLKQVRNKRLQGEVTGIRG